MAIFLHSIELFNRLISLCLFHIHFPLIELSLSSTDFIIYEQIHSPIFDYIVGLIVFYFNVYYSNRILIQPVGFLPYYHLIP